MNTFEKPDKIVVKEGEKGKGNKIMDFFDDVSLEAVKSFDSVSDSINDLVEERTLPLKTFVKNFGEKVKTLYRENKQYYTEKFTAEEAGGENFLSMKRAVRSNAFWATIEDILSAEDERLKGSAHFNYKKEESVLDTEKRASFGPHVGIKKQKLRTGSCEV